MRRTLIAALCVLGLSSGAWAQNGGYFTVSQKLDLYAKDSANELVGATIDDTLIYVTSPFAAKGPFSHVFVRFVQTTSDTATQTGLCRDSVIFQLQTKVAAESASVWYTIGETRLLAVASFDTVGGWADGDAGRIALVAADSAATLGDLYRIQTLYIAEEDSIRSHCVLRSSKFIDPLSSFVAAAIFADYGGPGIVAVTRVIPSRDGDSTFTIQGQGVTADNVGRDTSLAINASNWTRASLQYLFNDNDTGGAQDSLDFRLVFGWSNDRKNYTWLDSTAQRSTDSTFFFDTLVVRPFRWLKILAKPEIGGDSSGTTTGYLFLYVTENR